MANSGGNLDHPEGHLNRSGGHLDHAAGYTNSQMNVNSHMGNISFTSLNTFLVVKLQYNFLCLPVVRNAMGEIDVLRCIQCFHLSKATSWPFRLLAI